ncbi:MAG: Rpp14/Pop5 family protein [Candidatus Micrarchaeota archaeon]
MVRAGSLRKRYIVFRYSGPAADEPALKKAIYAEALRFFGEYGLSFVALKLVSFDNQKGTGILRCERAHLESVLGFLALVSSLDGSDARLIALKSSGTLRSLASVLDSTH